MEDLLDAIVLQTSSDYKRIGKNVALFTSGGCISVNVSDTAAQNNVNFVRFSDNTTNKLTKYIAPGTSISNPIDIPVWGLKRGWSYVFDSIVNVLEEVSFVYVIMLCVEMGSIFSYTESDSEALDEVNLIVNSIVSANCKKPLVLVLRSIGDKSQDD